MNKPFYKVIYSPSGMYPRKGEVLFWDEDLERYVFTDPEDGRHWRFKEETIKRRKDVFVIASN